MITYLLCTNLPGLSVQCTEHRVLDCIVSDSYQSVWAVARLRMKRPSGAEPVHEFKRNCVSLSVMRTETADYMTGYADCHAGLSKTKLHRVSEQNVKSSALVLFSYPKEFYIRILKSQNAIDIYLRRFLWTYCPGHEGVQGYGQKPTAWRKKLALRCGLHLG